MDPDRMELTVGPDDVQRVTVVRESDSNWRASYLMARVPIEGETLVLNGDEHLTVTNVLWMQTSTLDGEQVMILAPIVMVEEDPDHPPV
jgi:hypothetical protein